MNHNLDSHVVIKPSACKSVNVAGSHKVNYVEVRSMVLSMFIPLI